jgi:hypothetical protein
MNPISSLGPVAFVFCVFLAIAWMALPLFLIYRLGRIIDLLSAINKNTAPAAPAPAPAPVKKPAAGFINQRSVPSGPIGFSE